MTALNWLLNQIIARLAPIVAKLNQVLGNQATILASLQKVADSQGVILDNLIALNKLLDADERAIQQDVKATADKVDVVHKQIEALAAALPSGPGPAVKGSMTLWIEEDPMSFVLPDNKTATGVLDLTDAKHVHGATLDAAPTYQSSDPAVTVTADADDPLKFHVAVGDGASAGDVQVSAQCVAGGNSFVVQGVVTVGAGPAVEGAMSLSVDP